MIKTKEGKWIESPIHVFFELSYSSYLVIPRTLLEGMPEDWQHKFVSLLQDMEKVYDNDKIRDTYNVHLMDAESKVIQDCFADYRRPPKLPYRKEYQFLDGSVSKT